MTNIAIEVASTKQQNYINYLLMTYENIEDEDKQRDYCENIVNRERDIREENMLTKEDAYMIIKHIKNKFNIIDTRLDHQFEANCVPIACNNFFEIGWQMHDGSRNDDGIRNDLCYFKFSCLMVIDWDYMELEEVERILCEQAPDLTFSIYKTYKGYHGYCVSKPFHYDFKTMKLMKKLGCDSLYIQYCIKNGWMIRLNEKHDRDEQYIEKFVKHVGKVPMNPQLHILVKLKDLCFKKPIVF